MRNRGRGTKPSRFAMVGWFFLFLFLVVVISGGVAASFGYSPRARSLGWSLIIAGAILGVFTVDRWSRILPGIFGIAAINGLVILITGHALNESTVPVPRLVGALFTAVMATASIVTATFARRDLTNTDRAAYLGILACFVAMLVCVVSSVEHWILLVCIGFVGCIAVLGWRRFGSVSARGI